MLSDLWRRLYEAFSVFWQWVREALPGFWQWLYETFSSFWQWLHETSPGQPTFLGSLIGFLALLGGALFNARLPSEELSSAIKDIEATVTVLKSAIAELDRYEPRLRRAWRWMRATG